MLKENRHRLKEIGTRDVNMCV